MQLDIFENSRNVICRNAVIDALLAHDVAVAAQAMGDLVAEYPADAMTTSLGLLCDRLAMRVVAPLKRDKADQILRATEEIVIVAGRIFGPESSGWLSALWLELAHAIQGLPFDSGHENLHAAPLLLRAQNWTQACAVLEAIPSWRRQPAPVAWKIQATAKISGMDQIWPLVAELSWMAPHRAQQIVARLKLEKLTAMARSFSVEFEGEGVSNDFAWFPAWVLILHPALAECFHDIQEGADTPAERCARLVLSLLALERQGRHEKLIEARKKLRDSHAGLFECYMRTRPPSSGKGKLSSSI